ncbi:MAG: ATP-dependent protease [Oligoflexia bacterium]|nr:MAG: ATP-dependent protease [Oligoflexia bacterium]
MKVMSFIQEHNQLRPVEVELTLWAGLPGIQFLGLPDQHLKESSLRIKSAIKAQGFKFPTGQQILVNLRPSHLKKTSRGLELAVAMAYLWETGQISAPNEGEDQYIYGELSLNGEVHAPTDLFTSLKNKNLKIVTGRLDQVPQLQPFSLKSIDQLSKAEQPVILGPSVRSQYTRPQPSSGLKLSSSQANLVKMAAVGRHSLLLAGPAGTGKTTMAHILHACLPYPSTEQAEDISGDWYPFVKSHHSTPLMSMIGGGASPFAGEISRAHGGILFLDELLEFKAEVLEALREPFEEGVMRVARQGAVVQYPAEAQIVAATNLCPCGDYSPERTERTGCRYSLKRCKSYSEKLSGPFADRFQMLAFTRQERDQKIELSQLQDEIGEVFLFQKQRGQTKTNARVLISEIEKTVDSFALNNLMPETGSSLRRRHAILRVARTIADIQRSERVKGVHIEQAMLNAYINFERLKAWD